MSDERLIKAKFAGRCWKCDGPINIGVDVYWTKGGGVRHADEDGCSSAADHRQQDALNDFPPADWGDQ